MQIYLLFFPLHRSLELTISIPHNQNWQDWGARLTRKTAFHAAVNHYCRELGIHWANSPQPIFITSYNSDKPPTAEELGVEDEGDELAPDPISPGGVTSPVPSAQPTLFFTPPKDDARAGLRRRRKGNAGGANF